MATTDLKVLWKMDNVQDKYLKLGNELSEGLFGKVYDTVVKTNTGDIEGIIKIPKTSEKILLEEVKISKQLSSVPGCVKTLSIVECQVGDQSGIAECLVLEKLGDDIWTKLKKKENSFIHIPYNTNLYSRTGYDPNRYPPAGIVSWGQ